MKKTLNFTKFTVIAIAIGFISPAITMEKKSSSFTLSSINLSILNTLQAREDRN